MADASRILPHVDSIVGAAGGRVVAAREVRLSFDEVFAILVERAQAESARSAGRDDAGAGTPPDRAAA